MVRPPERTPKMQDKIGHVPMHSIRERANSRWPPRSKADGAGEPPWTTVVTDSDYKQTGEKYTGCWHTLGETGGKDRR